MSKTTTGSRQLLIMRHGKANWEMDIDDLQRPMTERGNQEAQNIGHWLSNHSYRPDVILSSTAARALATSKYVADALGVVEIKQDERIYNASLAQLLNVLTEIPAEVNRLMIVGHNPGFEDLLLHLVSVEGAFYREGGLMTTGTVAIVNMPDDWRQLDRQCGELVDVVRGGVL